MKKWIVGLIVVIVIVFLGLGGYLVYHNQQPEFKDSDGEDYFTKGFVYGRTFFGWRVISGDQCQGDNLLEKLVREELRNSGKLYHAADLYNCPNGCIGGACIK